MANSPEITISYNLSACGATIYERKLTISSRSIEKHCNAINKLFEKNNNNKVNSLKYMGIKLCNTLLPEEIQTRLKDSKAEHLRLELDSSLIHIPWELININDELIGDRFSIGRKIITDCEVTERKSTACETQSLNTWIITQSLEYLNEATKEGFWLCDKINKLKANSPEINCSHDSDVIVSDIIERIIQFDILHFAGHSDIKSHKPEERGWKLGNTEFFTANDVNELPSDTKLPSLIVSNACDSAITNQWEWQHENPKNPSTLPAAFIHSGVHHFIGTIWKIHDNSGILFTQSFYQQLFSGVPIGLALKHTRKEMLNKGAGICRSSYILYGDPKICYMKDKKPCLYLPEQKASHENDLTLTIKVEKIIEFRGPFQKIKEFFENHPLQQLLFSSLIVSILLLCAVIYAVSLKPQDIRSSNNVSSKDNCLERYKYIEAQIDSKLLEISKLRKDHPVTHIKMISTNDSWTSSPLYVAVVLSSEITCSFSDLTETIAVSIEKEILNKLWFPLIDRMKHVNLLDLVNGVYQSYLLGYPVGNFHAPDMRIRVELKQLKEGYIVQIRAIKITGEVVITFQKSYDDSISIASQVKPLSQELIQFLKRTYPLQGKILRLTDTHVTLNIGKNYKLKENEKFQTCFDNIVMTVSATSEYTSSFRILEENKQAVQNMKEEVCLYKLY